MLSQTSEGVVRDAPWGYSGAPIQNDGGGWPAFDMGVYPGGSLITGILRWFVCFVEMNEPSVSGCFMLFHDKHMAYDAGPAEASRYNLPTMKAC